MAESAACYFRPNNALSTTPIRMTDDLANDNPYRAAAPGDVTSRRDVELFRCEATLVARGWLYRKIELAAPLNVTIEYNGRTIGWESVSVNGRVAVRSISVFWFSPHFEFTISSDCGDFDAALEVSVALWFTLSEFVLSVAGREVYREG
jgi:hypothetical protein